MSKRMRQAISAKYRKSLDRLLGIADDEAFIQLVWATNLVQYDHVDAGVAYLKGMNAEFATQEISDKHFLYKWELETIVNEVLRVPKDRSRGGKIYSIDCSQFAVITSAIGLLRKLENSESGRWIRNKNILDEMPRIASRQFQWQRGWLNIQQFYRTARIYGQGKCAEYFENKYGITVNQFSLIGFSLNASFLRNPTVNADFDLALLGVPADLVERGLKMLSLPIEAARDKAIIMGKRVGPVAHRPSLLRLYPCLTFGSLGNKLRAPLPQLIIERVTSGIFYDVVDGGWDVREEYGRHFEQYSLDLLRATFSEIRLEPEHAYKLPAGEIKSPDILWLKDDRIRIAIECKATRQSFEAKFSEEPLKDRGYDDLIKAIFQIWRYFSHCRTGKSGFCLHPEAVGMVLTLDDWFTMANGLIEEILRKARNMADEKDKNITEEDRKPIIFCDISDLEVVLSKCSEGTFLKTIDLIVRDKKSGWYLSSVHDEVVSPENLVRRSYPFKDDIERLLPWFEDFRKASEITTRTQT